MANLAAFLGLNFQAHSPGAELKLHHKIVTYYVANIFNALLVNVAGK